MAQDKGQALNWDDNAQVSDGEYILFDPGEYPYVVKSFTRSWYNGSDKIAACNEAKMAITVTDPATGRTGDVLFSLYLNTKVLFKITAFFKSCGLIDPEAQDGDSFSLALFGQSIGRGGRVRLKHREYNGNTYNDIDQFLKPEPMASPAPAMPTPPAAPAWGGQGF